MIFTEGSGWNRAKGSQGEDYAGYRGAERQYFHQPKRIGGREHWVGASTLDSATNYGPQLYLFIKREGVIREPLGSGLALPVISRMALEAGGGLSTVEGRS